MMDLLPLYMFYLVKMLWYDEMDKQFDTVYVAPQGETCIDLSTGCHTQYEIAHWYDATGGVAP